MWKKKYGEWLKTSTGAGSRRTVIIGETLSRPGPAKGCSATELIQKYERLKTTGFSVS